MTKQFLDITLRKASIIAGVSILIMTIAAIVATDLTIGILVVQHDAEATFNNIKNSEMIFRIGVFSWLVILICDVIAAWGLFEFLKPINRGVSLFMAWFRLVYAAMLAVALVGYNQVLIIIGDTTYSTTFTNNQIYLLVMQSIITFQDMWSWGLIVFGIHIYFLGYLIVKSGYVPKYLGLILQLASLGYVLTNLSGLLLPGYAEIRTTLEWIFIIPMLSEVYLGFWLFIKGRKVEEIQSFNP